MSDDEMAIEGDRDVITDLTTRLDRLEAALSRIERVGVQRHHDLVRQITRLTDMLQAHCRASEDRWAEHRGLHEAVQRHQSEVDREQHERITQVDSRLSQVLQRGLPWAGGGVLLAELAEHLPVILRSIRVLLRGE